MIQSRRYTSSLPRQGNGIIRKVAREHIIESSLRLKMVGNPAEITAKRDQSKPTNSPLGVDQFDVFIERCDSSPL